MDLSINLCRCFSAIFYQFIRIKSRQLNLSSLLVSRDRIIDTSRYFLDFNNPIGNVTWIIHLVILQIIF